MNGYLKIRYVFDWLFALVLFPFCIPVFFIITFVQFYVFGDIIFIQQRTGLHGRIFTLFKFKTMIDDESLPEKERIPAWGKFLRNSGLDELPQILNILSGDMVFIGPRPLLPQYTKLYSAQQARRTHVKPGLTGYAQALHRNDTTWEQRFEHDVYYVHRASPILDLKIIWKSLQQLNKGDQKILEPFEGNK